MTTQDEVFAGIREARQRRDSGDRAGAQAILDELWDAVTTGGNDYLAIAVAHDYGHLQTEPREQLRWHLDALDRIERFEPQEDVRLFWPSAYANVGHAHLRAGDADQAQRYLVLADEAAGVLGDDAYGRQVREGIAIGLRDLGNTGLGNADLGNAGGGDMHAR